MGTRGFIGFVAGGQEKVAYNHFDSYPESLGMRVLEWLRVAAKDPAGLRERVVALRVVSPGSQPSPEDVERLSPFTSLNVGEQAVTDWYCLLRKTQGDPEAMLAAGVIEDAGDFPLDGPWAEWGYVVDLDGDGLLEVYEGFQKRPHDEGRWGGRPANEHGYYPVKRVARWPLAQLPSDDEMKALEGGDGGE